MVGLCEWLISCEAESPETRSSRRNEVGLDVAIEALKLYMAQGKLKVDLIMEYATKLRVAKTMRPYLEAIL